MVFLFFVLAAFFALWAEKRYGYQGGGSVLIFLILASVAGCPFFAMLALSIAGIFAVIFEGLTILVRA